MKKRIVYKGFAALASLMILFSMSSLSVQASAPEMSASISHIGQSEIQPRADIINTVLRNHPDNGRLQYRRWNATRGYWIDADWIYV